VFLAIVYCSSSMVYKCLALIPCWSWLWCDWKAR